MASENKVDRLETLRRDALESIEKLVAIDRAAAGFLADRNRDPTQLFDPGQHARVDTILVLHVFSPAAWGGACAADNSTSVSEAFAALQSRKLPYLIGKSVIAFVT